MSEDVEMAMTFLSQPQPWMTEARRLRNRALFLELTEAIAAEIEQSAASARQSVCPAWLLRFVHWLHFRRAVVITLNYDTLLESAVLEIPRADCQPKQLVPFRFAADEAVMSGGDVRANSLELLKLHGSINWRYSGRASYSGELIQWSMIRRWSQGDPEINTEKRGDTLPLIIPPVAEKAGYFAHHSVQHLWGRAAQALAEARRVFCIGYSLPTTDLTIRFLLADLVVSDPVEFYLVNLPVTADGSSVEGHYQQILPDSFLIKSRFIGSNPVPPFVDDLFTDEFFPDSVDASGRGSGQVESAVRSRVRVGQSFMAALDAGIFSVAAFSPHSITLRLGEAEIPIRVPWESLEAIEIDLSRSHRQRLTIDELDTGLHKYCDRYLGPWIAALIEAAGVVTVWRDHSHWVISPAGANEQEIAHSRNVANA